MYEDATDIWINIQRLYLCTLTAWSANDIVIEIPHEAENGDLFRNLENNWQNHFPGEPTPHDIAKTISIKLRKFLREEDFHVVSTNEDKLLIHTAKPL